MLNMTGQAPNRSSLAYPRSGGAGTRHAETLLVVVGVLGALAASSCCIAPLLLFALGVSGAWIANLTQLAPYQPLFIAHCSSPPRRAASAPAIGSSTGRERSPVRVTKPAPGSCRTGW